MAQECGFFNAQLVGEEYDRVYLAEQFAAYFASFIGNGVFGSSMQQLKVLAQDTANMSVKVGSGQAWINGWWYRNTDAYTLDIDVADGALSRIDLIVLRWGQTERDMWLQVVKGTPSANPVAPSISRGADYYDLQLATVSIPAGAIKITQAQITDTRLDNSVCGLVTGVVDQIDTTDLYNQFETYFAEFKQIYETDMDDWTDAQKAAFDAWVLETQGDYDDYVDATEQDYAGWTQDKKDEYDAWYDTHIAQWQLEFETWFQNVKDQLSTDVAGHLQEQINEHEALLNSLAKMLIQNVITMPIELSDGTLLATTDNEVLLFEESHVIAPCNCNHS